MARLVGKNLKVTIDGSGVDYELGWSCDWNTELMRHRGATHAQTRKAIGETTRTGSFRCEADPSDSVQESLMDGAQTVTLRLYEVSGTSYQFEAIVWPGVAVERGGKSIRTFTFEETDT